MRGRSTTISYDDHVSQNYAITNRVDQGCPLSVILYLFYNADLLDIANPLNGKLAVGFMDDIIFAIRAKDFDLVVTKVQNIWTRPAGVKEWSQLHHSHFGIEKFGLLGATRRREADPQRPGKTKRIARPSIIINGHTIRPTTSVKYLGVLMDKELRFTDHANYALAKGTKWVLQVA